MAASVDWSSLPSDLINRIADCLLATNDIDYFMDLRTVCSTWRSATTDAKKNLDEPFFRPSPWIVMDEVSYSLEFRDRTRLLVNTATGRVLRKDLPRNYFVIATTPGGFFVLAHKKPPHATSVLNPFTGRLVPFMAPMVTDKVDAAVIAGTTLILFCDSSRKMYMANAHSGCFDASYGNNYPKKKLCLLAILGTGHDVSTKMFYLMGSFDVHPTEMLTVYPFEDTVDDYGARNTGRCFLVESAGKMLMIFKLQERMEVFKLDNDKSAPEPVKSIGNQAIFLGYRKCLSVNADKFQMVGANCIYHVKSREEGLFCHCDIYKYDLKDEKEEMISGAINTINDIMLVDADPPFTIIQLLSSYTFNALGSELEEQKSF